MSERTVTHHDDGPYVHNADWWIGKIREGHDRYRVEFTDKVMVDALAPQSGEVIVDAGCGEGWLSRVCAAAGAQVIGVDLSPAFIAAAREGTNGMRPAPRFEVADMRALPLPDTSVDVVASCHTLTDVPDASEAIREFARVLRPGGRLVALAVHPCFYGQRADREAMMAMPTAADYFGRRVVRQPFSMGGETSPAGVTTYLWPLTDWFSWIFGAGLVLTQVSEPRPGPELVVDPWWQQHFPRPLFLLIEARKATVG
jgi:ubiquinone/menaquinone biosynthesis C-methylase UbiE